MPEVLSSVYFYYDPDLKNLEFGKASSIIEINHII